MEVHHYEYIACSECDIIHLYTYSGVLPAIYIPNTGKYLHDNNK